MLYFLAPRILFGKRRLERVHLEYMRGQAGAPSHLFSSHFKLYHWGGEEIKINKKIHFSLRLLGSLAGMPGWEGRCAAGQERAGEFGAPGWAGFPSVLNLIESVAW